MSSTPGRPSDAPSFAEIEAFMAVVAHGSFSAAATRLGVAKSSISRRVASLEQRLGARLLQRSTRRLALTEVGERYHQEVALALEGLRAAEDAVREVQDEPRGELRITAPVDLGGLLGVLVAEFRLAFPKVVVNATITQRRVDLVREGFDIALRAGELQDSSLTARKLDGGESVVVASPDFLGRHFTPSTLAEAVELPWVLFRGNHGQMALPWNDDAGEPVIARGEVTGDEFGFVRAAVVQGVGIGSIPSFVAEQDLKAARLVRLFPELPTQRTPLALVFPSREHLPAKVRAFTDFAVPWFRRRMSYDEPG
ncbi:MAG: LysR family transcriptional regulator [Nannocystaceae bacterium]|nr:LysR family transcriptional regulator [Nannocystaceae bacterium]